MKPDPDIMLAARRALFEGAAPTLERIAMACGASHVRLVKLARQEGWRRRSTEGGAGSILARVQAVKIRLLETIERKQAPGEDGAGGLDAASIADLTAIARMLDKLGEDTRDSAKENQVDNDHDIAGLLDRLDRKIIELAAHLAQEMAESQSDRQRDRGASS